MTNKSLRDQLIQLGAETGNNPSPSVPGQQAPVIDGGDLEHKLKAVAPAFDKDLQAAGQPTLQELRIWEAQLKEREALLQQRETAVGGKERTVDQASERLKSRESDLALREKQVADLDAKQQQHQVRISQLESEWARVRELERESLAVLDEKSSLVARETKVKNDEALLYESFEALTELEKALLLREQKQEAIEGELLEAKTALAVTSSDLVAAKDVIATNAQLMEALKSEYLGLPDELRKSNEDLEDVRKELRKSERQRKSIDGKMVVLEGELELIRAKHQKLTDTSLKRLAIIKEHERKIVGLEDELSEVQKEHLKKVRALERALAKAEARLDSLKPNETFFPPDLPLLAQLIAAGETNDIELPMHSCTAGCGPWEEAEFDEFLKGMKIKPCDLPDEEESLVIVGRHLDSMDGLIEQIQARDGLPLRIYSQELFIMGLLRNEDPLEVWDRELLEAWGRAHPILSILMDLEFPWPTVTDTEDLDDPDEDAFVEQVQESPLHAMGYKVGRTGLNTRERRVILTEAVEGQLEWVESDEYMEKWGQNGSAKRLRRIAKHLAYLANGQGRSAQRVMSRAEWIEDLVWLRKAYYEKFKHRFIWPNLG